jgi:hypothetical protein
LGQRVVELGAAPGLVEGDQAQVVIGARRAVALREALGNRLERTARLLDVALDLGLIAADLEHRVVDRLGVRKARHDRVEVVERLLVLALRVIAAAVVQQALRLLFGRALGPGCGRQQQGRGCQRPRRALHSRRPIT